jgi:hypothetical protein
MANNGQRETLPQNTNTPTRDETHNKWRHSVLVGPQTAGIPTVHNNDEWARDNDVLGGNDDMVPSNRKPLDGGAVAYNRSQRK